MKNSKYVCRNCGSTNIAYTRKVGGVIDLKVKSGCRNCGSKDITYCTVSCDECSCFSLFFDDLRFEVVCRSCGLVHAGTDVNMVYPLGFLLRRPNLRLF